MVFIALPLNIAMSGENPRSENLREHSVSILSETMRADTDFRVRVRAAEALLWNVYLDEVEGFFSGLQAGDGLSSIAVSRIGAELNKKNAVIRQEYINRIRDEVFKPASVERIYALECLAELGWSEDSPEIIRLAEDGDKEEKVYARWIIANSGNTEDEAYLSELLTSDIPREYSSAAYALRNKNGLSKNSIQQLRACAARTAVDDSGRVYIMSALFVHAPAKERIESKKKLFGFSEGGEFERREICEALAIAGDADDRDFLEALLSDSEISVKVSAANALLRIERREFRGLRWPDWVIVGFFIVAMLMIGWYYSARQSTAEEYLVGSRSVSSVVSGISLFASLVSTIGYLANAGEAIKHGPMMLFIQLLSLPVIYFLGAYLLIPVFMKYPITSAYEIIEKKLGRGVQIAGSGIFVVTRLVWMALLIYLTSKAMVVMLNWDEKYILYISIAGGIVPVIYSTLGGLRAVLITDVSQSIVLVLGAITTIVFIVLKMEDAGAFIPAVWMSNWDSPVFISFSPYVRLSMFFYTSPSGYLVDQHCRFRSNGHSAFYRDKGCKGGAACVFYDAGL